MTTQPFTFDIVSAPVAAFDRRALSQAWYSALHLAKDGPPVSDARAPHAMRAEESPHRPPALQKDARTPHAPETSATRERRAPHRIGRFVERRALRSPLARKIERTFLDPRMRATRGTFAIDAGGARVHVALQQTPGGLRLIAVCGARVRERVARALEEARYALAARGIALDTMVDGVSS